MPLKKAPDSLAAMKIETEGETIYKDIKLFLWWNYNDFKKEGREREMAQRTGGLLSAFE